VPDQGRSFHAVTEVALEQLMVAGLEENQRFFRTNSPVQEYRDRLVAICLCGEGARHFLDGRSGLDRFDVWLFYRAIEGKPLPEGPEGRRDFEYEPFQNMTVAFRRRAIPGDFFSLDDIVMVVSDYILGLEKEGRGICEPFVGLYPDDIFGRTVCSGSCRI